MATSDEWKGLGIRQAHIPVRYAGALEIDLDERARPFLEGRCAELALQGPLGTGKSWQATRVLAEWMRLHPPEVREGRAPRHHEICQCPSCLPSTRYRASWWDASLLAQQIADEWRDSDARTKEAAMGVECLLLDDVGAESGSDAIQAEISHVLRHRYNACRPTIITCQSLDLLEGRIASRFSSLVLKMNGGDQRIGSVS